ncbi:MAG: MtrB/PioB family outer membrane beta-barrel protein, partial [Alphaproteobacteria bacterium]|nr:MtrB/PioB family outer membrane beta-barrel protein [Alphaproteobacteria bacterium]
MITWHALGAIAVAGTCICPVAALAQTTPPDTASAPPLGATRAASADAPPAATPVLVPGGASSWADAMALAIPPAEAPAWAPTWALPPLPPPATAPVAAPAAAPAAPPGEEPLVSYLPLITGEVEIGAGSVSGHNAYWGGRYTGLNTTGFDLLGQFNLGYRDAWDSGGTKYFQAFGNNLVFQTGDGFANNVTYSNSPTNRVTNSIANAGSLGLNFGEQGAWESALGFRSIPYTGNIIDSLYNVNGGQAALNPNLIPFGGATPTKAGPITGFTVPTLNSTGAEQPFLVGTRRDILDGNFKKIWGDWTFTGEINHQNKRGSLEESYVGTFAGTAFTLPIDYDMTRYDATAAYDTTVNQAQLQYTFSQFTDKTLFVALPYFVSNTVKPFQLQAAYSLPPNNSAHYATILLASNAVPETRLNLNARVGVEKQNDGFPPNTADPGGENLVGANLTGLNSNLQGTTAGSPDITATVYQVNASANSHPLPDFDSRVYYGIDGRNVSLNQFAVTTGGTGGEAADKTPGGATNVAFVVPQDWTKQHGGFELGYKAIPEDNTRLTLGYRFDNTNRSNAQVGHSWADNASAGVSSNLGPQVQGRLRFDYSTRNGTLNYLTPWQNLTGSPDSATFSGAYYQAPMHAEKVRAESSYTPMNNLSGDLFVEFKDETFTFPPANATNGVTPSNPAPISGSGQGLKQYYSLTLGPDVNWRATDKVDLHFFYTYERLYFDNTGNGNCSTPAQAALAAVCGPITANPGLFRNQETTGTNTVGVNGEWQVNDSLKLKANYTFQYGTITFNQFDGVFVPNPTQSFQNVVNYPDINTRMHDLRVTGTYKLTDGIDFVALVGWSYFHNNDWNNTANAVQGGPSPTIAYLTPGYYAPTWSVVTAFGGLK